MSYQDFISFAEKYGLIIEDIVIGRKVRVPTVDGKRGSRDGEYCLYDDELGIAGWLKNYKTDEFVKYGHKMNNSDDIEVKQILNDRKKATECELAKLHDKQAEVAEYLCNKVFKPASVQHPYLMRKGIKAYKTLIDKTGALIIPMKNTEGIIRSFTKITEDGVKSYMTNAEKRGCYYQFGFIKKRVIICEGFSTGASIYDITGVATLSAFDASNLEHVAIAIRKKYGKELEIIIAGDDDHKQPRNAGKLSAEKAALAVNGKCVLPNLTKKDKELGYTDFNDIAQNRAKELIIKQILG